jgi:signal peptidase I
LPQFGPVLRIFSMSSSSMAPTYPERSSVFVNRAAYGYSRASFDWFALPISGRWLRFGAPQRGDVVVFRLPRDERTIYIKRLIGLPGDKVQLKAGRVYINGAVLARAALPARALTDALDRRATVAAWHESLPEGSAHEIIEAEGDEGFLDNTPLFEVPSGSYFFLGDNRDNSVDSRTEAAKGGAGFVPEELLIGKVIAAWGAG